jgi:hypothetical protein
LVFDIGEVWANGPVQGIEKADFCRRKVCEVEENLGSPARECGKPRGAFLRVAELGPIVTERDALITQPSEDHKCAAESVTVRERELQPVPGDPCVVESMEACSQQTQEQQDKIDRIRDGA